MSEPGLARRFVPTSLTLRQEEVKTVLGLMTLVATHDLHGWDGWFLWPLLGLLLPVAGVVLCVWLVVRPVGPLTRRSGREEAADILARRYARGELTRDEYRERLQDLES
jgi:putative membrane protein